MGLLDYLQNVRANYDRIREEQKKRSLLSQLGRAASAIIPDPIEQKISSALSPVMTSARDSARQAAVNTASALPFVGPAIRAADAFRSAPEPVRNEIAQNAGATASLAGKIGLGALQGVGEFGARQMDRVFGFNGQKPLDIGGIASDVGAIPRDFLIRPTYRAATGFATSGISRLMGIETPESIPAPTSKLGQFFLGTDPIKSVRGMEQAAPATAEALGYSPAFAQNAAPFIGVGLMASDLFPFSPKKAGGKVAREIAEDAATKAAKEAAEKAAREAVGDVGEAAVRDVISSANKPAAFGNVLDTIKQTSKKEDVLTVFSGSEKAKGSRYFTADKAYAETYAGKNGSVTSVEIPKSQIFDTRNPQDLEILKKVSPDTEVDSTSNLVISTGDAKTLENRLRQAGYKYDAIALSENTGLGDDVSYFVARPFLERNPKATSLRQALPEASRAALPGTGGIPTPEVPLSKAHGEISSFYNTDRLNIPQAGRDAIQAEIRNAQKIIKDTVGETLTNKEVLDRAATTSKVWNQIIPRELTEAKAASNLKLRQEIAAMRKTETVDENYVRLLLADKSYSGDIARRLQARKIGADPKTASSIDSLLESIRKTGAEADDIIEASKGVDFTNPEAVAAFYRKFVKPKASDWIDLIRYNSMLSSPTTHLVNIMSNFVNTGIVAPIEKTVSGLVDATRSAIFGTQRTHFAGEGLAYAKGYYSNLRTASQKFWDAFGQKTLSGNIDTRSIPMALEGTKARKIENVLAIPSRLLEAADQFAVSLVESGAESGLKFKAARGVDVGDIAQKSSEEAAYRLYRQRIGSRDEGYLLGALETLPGAILEWRNSKNPFTRNLFKWTFPFVNTGTQLFKQGVEYSPLGLATLAGNPAKVEQLTKAAIGTATAIAIATLVEGDKITWAEPTDTEQKNAFRAAGMQPYSVKIGDTWVQYSKLPPVLAWNFALVAAVKDSNANQKIDDSTADKILSIASKYLTFFTDQSYMKQVGSIVNASKGDEFALTNFATSFPQQLIPFRGLMSWIERAIDPVQRQADPEGTDLERSLQTMMAQIPGLANLVPPRMGPDGQPVENQNRILNALSPIKMTNEDPEGAKTYQDILSAVRTNQEETRAAADLRARATKTDLEILALPPAERAARFDEIAATDPALADKIREVAKERALNLTELDRKIKELNIGNGNRAQFIWNQLQSMSTDEQRAQYWDDLAKKGIITDEVAKQLRELIGK